MDSWETSKQTPLHIYDSAFCICFSRFLGGHGVIQICGPCQKSLLVKNVKFPHDSSGVYTTDSKRRRGWRNRWCGGMREGRLYTWHWRQSHGKTWQKQEHSCGWRLRDKRIWENVANGRKTKANIDLWYHFYLLCHCFLQSTSQAYLLVCWVLRRS